MAERRRTDPFADIPLPGEEDPFADIPMPDNRGTFEQIGDFITDDVPGAGEAIYEFGEDVLTAAVGDNPLEFPHRPEFFKRFAGNVTDWEEVEMNFLSQLPRSIAGKMEMITKFAPTATFPSDKFGNLMVVVPEGKFKGSFYMNKPGLSESDMQDVSAEMLFQLPMMVGVTKVLGLAAGGTGFWGTVFGTGARVGGTSLGAGGGSLLRDLAAEFAGAESQSLDIDHALLSAAFGAFGESAIAALPIIGKALGIVLKNDKLWSRGKLTRAGRRAVKRLGVDPEIVTPEFAKKYRISIRRGASAEQAARRAEAATLETAIPGGKNIELTEGQAAGLAALQTEEQLAAKGAFGAEAEQKVGAIIGPGGIQDDAMMANRHAIERNLTGREGVPQSETGQGAKVTQEALAAKSEAARQAKTDAYGVVERSPGTLGTGGVIEMQERIAASIERFSPATGSAPATHHIVHKEMPDLFAAAEGQTLTQVTVQKLEQIRQRISALTGNKGPEGAAARAAKDAYDDAFHDMVIQGLIRGDDGIEAALLSARKLNEIFRIKFGEKSQDIVNRIVTRGRTIDEAGDPVYGELLMSPEKVANLLLGSAKLGADTSKVLTRIKNILGESSEGWRSLKGEAWFKLFASQEGRGAGAASFSPAKYRSALDDATRNWPSMMRVLFTKQEMSQMQAFKRVSQSLIPGPGAVNTSNSAVSILNTLTKNFGPIGRAASSSVLRKWAEAADKGAAATRAIQATTKPRPVNERKVAPSDLRLMITPRRGSAAGLPPAGSVAENRRRQRELGAFGWPKGRW